MNPSQMLRFDPLAPQKRTSLHDVSCIYRDKVDQYCDFNSLLMHSLFKS